MPQPSFAAGTASLAFEDPPNILAWQDPGREEANVTWDVSNVDFSAALLDRKLPPPLIQHKRRCMRYVETSLVNKPRRKENG